MCSKFNTDHLKTVEGWDTTFHQLPNRPSADSSLTPTPISLEYNKATTYIAVNEYLFWCIG